MAKRKSTAPKQEPAEKPAEPGAARTKQTAPSESADKPTSKPHWTETLKNASDTEITKCVTDAITDVVQEHRDKLNDYTVLGLLEPDDSINTYDLTKINTALAEPESLGRDVLLVLLSRGGLIEPAYQISKLCKSHSKSRFVVAIPRQAKSAATLIALGADEIHMSALGQLGPIDPQLDGMPALGVNQALQTIASLSAQFPGSADMFARYLQRVLTVEQIGYCDRVSESAAQYAERLLSTKKKLASSAQQIAHTFVYEYKDHGFVIDQEEARKHLGNAWIKTDTVELEFAEELYSRFELLNLFLRFQRNKRALALGSLRNPLVFVFDIDRC